MFGNEVEVSTTLRDFRGVFMPLETKNFNTNVAGGFIVLNCPITSSEVACCKRSGCIAIQIKDIQTVSWIVQEG